MDITFFFIFLVPWLSSLVICQANPCNVSFPLQQITLNDDNHPIPLLHPWMNKYLVTFTPKNTSSYFFALNTSYTFSSATLYAGEFRGTTCPGNSSLVIARKNQLNGHFIFESVFLSGNQMYTIEIESSAKFLPSMVLGVDYFSYQFPFFAPMLLLPPLLLGASYFALLRYVQRTRAFTEPYDHEITTWKRWGILSYITGLLVIFTVWAIPYSALALGVTLYVLVRSIHIWQPVAFPSSFHANVWLLLLLALNFPLAVWDSMSLFLLAIQTVCRTNGCVLEVWTVPLFGILSLLGQVLFLVSFAMYTSSALNLKRTYFMHRELVYLCPQCDLVNPSPSVPCPTCHQPVDFFDHYKLVGKCPQCQAIVARQDETCTEVDCFECHHHFVWSHCVCPHCTNLLPSDLVSTTVCQHCSREVPSDQMLRRFRRRPHFRPQDLLLEPQLWSSVNPLQRDGDDGAESSWINKWIHEEEKNEEGTGSDGSKIEFCRICEDRPSKWQLTCGHCLCKPCLVAIFQRNRLCPFDRKPIESPPLLAKPRDSTI